MSGGAMSKVDCAVALARRGFHIFPVAPDVKTPAVTGWQEWATRDKNKIRARWKLDRDASPDANIGIATGKFGENQALIVLDIDTKAGKQGAESIKKLAADGYPLPATFTVITASGGWHKYYTAPQPVKQGVNVIGPGVDIRSNGGYVVGPGSTIKGRDYEITDNREPVPAPAWVIEKCGAPRARTETAPAPVKGVDLTAATARAIHYLQHDAPPAIEGSGGDATTYATAARVKDLGIPNAGTCAALMIEHWNGRCSPPWDADDLRAKCRNAFTYGLNPPGAAAPEAIFSIVPAPDAMPSPALITDRGGYLVPNLPPFNPNESRIGDIFTNPPVRPRFIVQDFYPVACGQENSVGGLGKTTRRLWEAVHLILGRPLYGYPVLRSGPVLIVTKEDGADIFRYRMHRVAMAMDLSPADQKRITQNLHVLDLTGDVAARLVAVDREGNLYATDLAERIYCGYRREGLAQVSFDPWNGFSPGERFVNDAEAALMVAGAMLSRELDCNTCYVGHVSKTVARQGIIDAHSGRGGAAMGDNARFVFNYVPHDQKEDSKAWPAPAEAERAAAQGNLFRLHITKQSYAKRPTEPVWIERQGYGFTVHQGAPATPAARLEAEGERVKAFVQQELERGIRYMGRPLEEQHDRYGMGRNKARQVIGWLISAGGLIERQLSESERRGKFTQYLEPVFPQAPELGTADPFQ
ncbi:MAG: bifunctional DNA primase/polymerase [Betaproteobacteria bacterium]|nr:bifunctional DNA primase/polymerase [Betaproteobacteria bacterium]